MYALLPKTLRTRQQIYFFCVHVCVQTSLTSLTATIHVSISPTSQEVYHLGCPRQSLLHNRKRTTTRRDAKLAPMHLSPKIKRHGPNMLGWRDLHPCTSTQRYAPIYRVSNYLPRTSSRKEPRHLHSRNQHPIRLVRPSIFQSFSIGSTIYSPQTAQEIRTTNSLERNVAYSLCA